jgi:hypothetical protein
MEERGNVIVKEGERMSSRRGGQWQSYRGRLENLPFRFEARLGEDIVNFEVSQLRLKRGRTREIE